MPSVLAGCRAHSIYFVPANGSGGQRLLTRSECARTPTSWSVDGRSVMLMEGNPATGNDLWVIRLDDAGEVVAVEEFLVTRFNEAGAVFSPDGSWVAYASDESGRSEIQVRSYPDGARKVQISQSGGVQPRWRADGRELFFRGGDQVLAVPIETGEGLQAGTPTVLFERPMQATTYDVTPDGQRFLMVRVDEVASPDRLELVLGWSRELAERFPR